MIFGTTSACAENTRGSVPTLRENGNYLRVRGEYYAPEGPTVFIEELPPRARRIPEVAADPRSLVGTTSACAENTSGGGVEPAGYRNYLRVRGEYFPLPYRIRLTMELPPRARRIPDRDHGFDEMFGTTSACAENTYCSLFYHQAQWNYLRVRGEYLTPLLTPQPYTELPPRARRILACERGFGCGSGTTSACAENTPLGPLNSVCPGNYLRVRGEYFTLAGVMSCK